MNIDPNLIPAVNIPAGVLPLVLMISAFIAALIQAVRKTPVVGLFVDTYLKELLPFAAIAAGVLAARAFLNMTGINALLAGFIMGQAATGNYEFIKRFKMPDMPKSTPLIIPVLLLVLPLCGCRDLSLSDKYNDHLKETITTASPYYLKCSQFDEPNDCAACLAMAAAELDHINSGLADANKPVKMTYKLKQKFQIQRLIADELRQRCINGDTNACRLGALREFKFLEHIYKGANDVNIAD